MPKTSERGNATLSQIECHRRGWEFRRVGWFDARARRNHDLLGFVDALAFAAGETFALQFCSATDVARRVRKIERHENLRVALAGGWRVLVWGWRPNGTLREVEIGRDG